MKNSDNELILAADWPNFSNQQQQQRREWPRRDEVGHLFALTKFSSRVAIEKSNHEYNVSKWVRLNWRPLLTCRFSPRLSCDFIPNSLHQKYNKNKTTKSSKLILIMHFIFDFLHKCPLYVPLIPQSFCYCSILSIGSFSSPELQLPWI